MKLDLRFEKIFPRDIGTVWRALVDPEAIATWLMQTDFQPQLGRPFRLWFESADGTRCSFDCELLELDPPRRMVWSWVDTERKSEGPMRVSFTLEPLPEGTRLTITHRGERDPETIESFREGWPGKIEALQAHLAL